MRDVPENLESGREREEQAPLKQRERGGEGRDEMGNREMFMFRRGKETKKKGQ